MYMTCDILEDMKMHTPEYKKMMSEKKKLWWENVKKDPARLAATLEKMSVNNAKNMLGKKREDHPGWKGGKYIDTRDGYVFVRVVGKGRSDGYVLEHRHVMEEFLGRALTKEEDVNHINGKKDDNRIENLRVVRHYAHYEEMKCPKCDFVFHTR